MKAKKLYRKSERSRLWVKLAAVAAFLLLCFILSVAVGLILGEQAESYQEPSVRFDFSEALYNADGKEVPTVDAYLFRMGADPASYIKGGITDLSLCLQDSRGVLSYPTSVRLELWAETESGESAETEETAESLLAETVRRIKAAGARTCGYFYVQAFFETDPYLFELRAAYEAALIREAALCGVDEFLLILPQVGEESIGEIEQYISRLAYAAGERALGVLIAPETFHEGGYLASRLASVCDFAALDLRGLDAEAFLSEETETDAEGVPLPGALEVLLSENEYFINAYGLRLVLSHENATLYEELKTFGVTNLQIIGD